MSSHAATMTLPIESKPRRPARPAICVYSPGKRNLCVCVVYVCACVWNLLCLHHEVAVDSLQGPVCVYVSYFQGLVATAKNKGPHNWKKKECAP